jgi:glutamate-1-semialdehyde 2,1-aminomutase
MADLRNITHFEKSDLYRSRIHDLIPGGAHTYSKGDDQFPILSPAAFTHGKGAYLFDQDGNQFLDCTMSLAAVSLGHAFEPVVHRVIEEVKKGVNFGRPSTIEMEMAEKFLDLVPCHQMIKFAKNGSTITTAAVKIARAFTGRKLVAFPGDHPFYSYDDWFIGATACTAGIPDDFGLLSVKYNSKDPQSLKDVFAKHPGKIACVISEPERQDEQPFGHLKELIDIAHANGALFIQDEMITGFKTDFPGSIKKFGVEPDMTTWGKGIGNGFSFCALTGKKEVMELGGIRKSGAPKLFLISTTHGGETHAIAAGLEVIDIFKKHDVASYNKKIGRRFIEKMSAIIEKKGLKEHVQVVPADWMPGLIYKDSTGAVSQGMRTLVMQEMIKRGVFYAANFVPCFSHTNEDVDYFASAFEEAMSVYTDALEVGYEKFLKGPPARPVFRPTI